MGSVSSVSGRKRKGTLTVHFVSGLGIVVLRHGQQVTPRIRLGQRPAFGQRQVFDDGCGNAAVFVDDYESLAVSS